MSTVEKRLADERKVIRKLIRVAKAHGYTLWRIWDGEENEYPATENEALEVVFGVDECWMRFKHPDRRPQTHVAYIVLGNSGPEVIADCSVGEGWDAVMVEMNEYTDKMAEES